VPESPNPAGGKSTHTQAKAAQTGSSSVMLSVSSLVPADSPRLEGVDEQYMQQLANREDPLPPILVNRSTMRVIDGMHRLGAAGLRGDEFIEARYYDGPEADEFIEAVRLNVLHGKTLTRTDRIAAAERIIKTHPFWSDRKIASLTDVASATVAAIRRRSTDSTDHLNARVGRDGRARPINAAEGRERASKFLADNPDASLRQIATAAGVAPATAKDVRDRLRRGQDPLPEAQRNRVQSGHSPTPVMPKKERPQGHSSPLDIKLVLQRLGRDPALRLNEQGRGLLRLLSMHEKAGSATNWDRIATMVPAHCSDMVAQAARQCAATWLALAECIEEKNGGALT
jgi:hypothetical protein